MPQIVHCSIYIRLVHIARPITGDAFSLNRKLDHACQPDGQQDQISQMPVTATNTVITCVVQYTKCCAQMAESGQIADLDTTTD